MMSCPAMKYTKTITGPDCTEIHWSNGTVETLSSNGRSSFRGPGIIIALPTCGNGCDSPELSDDVLTGERFCVCGWRSGTLDC